MTTHDESPIIRTSSKRMAQGIAIVVALVAIGAAIIIPFWNVMVEHPPAASLIRPKAPPLEESGTGTSLGTVEGLTKPAEQTAPSGGAAAPSAANATGAKAGATAAAGTPLTILSGANVQGNPAFDPNPISVKKGDTITVTNKDTLPHTVTSGTGPSDPTSAKSFDTSIIEAGATADISTASLAPGDFPFYCTVHPYMTGKLTLTAGGGGAAATGSTPSAANATSAPSAANATGAKAGATAAAGTPLTILSRCNMYRAILHLIQIQYR